MYPRAILLWVLAISVVVVASTDEEIFAAVLRTCTDACDQRLKLPADVCQHSICRFVAHVREEHGAYLRWVHQQHSESPAMVAYAMSDAVDYIHRANSDDPHTLERYFATRLLHWEQQIQRQRDEAARAALDDHDEL